MNNQVKEVTLDVSGQVLHGVVHLDWVLYTHAVCENGIIMGFDSLYDEKKPECSLHVPIRIIKMEDNKFSLFSEHFGEVNGIPKEKLGHVMNNKFGKMVNGVIKSVVTENHTKLTKTAETASEGTREAEVEKAIMELLCEELKTTPEIIANMAKGAGALL